MPEVDAALAVLLLGLESVSKLRGMQRPHVARRCPRVTPLNSSETNVKAIAVGAVEAAQRLEQRAAEAGVAGRIGRERRREVRPGAGCWPARRAARSPGRRRCRGLPSPSAGRAGARVGFADAGDRAPELVEVLRLPDRDAGVGHRHVHERQQPRELDARPVPLAAARSAPRSGCRAAAARTGSACRRRPSRCRRGLVLACARSAWRLPSPPRRFTSLKAARTPRCRGAGGGGARNCSAERSTNGSTSPQCAPSASGIWLIGSWRHFPGCVARDVVDADARLGVVRAVVRAQREDRRGRAPSERDAALLARAGRGSGRGLPRGARRSAALCDGNIATSVSCAACAIAASIEVSADARGRPV